MIGRHLVPLRDPAHAPSNWDSDQEPRTSMGQDPGWDPLSRPRSHACLELGQPLLNHMGSAKERSGFLKKKGGVQLREILFIRKMQE